ncbi:CIA30 family protein [Pelagicoccus sp. SDUM812002]|uniref:CIA30 family protein n=1 Tax=Pelagicoccus sp. SDUM812002 TaxID=3041266 RepID=UPI002810FA1E|nr:CIA30 family protein [Pelagicoccus sp. SDUM812002]
MSARTIATFDNAIEFRNWTVVNDTVMGGVSQSIFEQTSYGNLLFSGELSLENNGGFVSIRNRPQPLDLRKGSEIKLRVRGDGRTYYFDLRPSNQRMAGSFRTAFATKDDEWQEISLPLTSFAAQSFGRPQPKVNLDPETITSIGFTLSDKKPGPFHLEVDYVESESPTTSTRAEEPLRTPRSSDSVEQKLQLISLAIERGVPLFNDGNPAACAAIYEVACTALIALPGTNDSEAANLRVALRETETTDNPVKKAWILRYALDASLARLVDQQP